VRSGTDADLAAGAGRILVVTPALEDGRSRSATWDGEIWR
jgi:hypothetical protein